MNEWIDRNRRHTMTDGTTGFSINFAGMKFDDGDLDAMAGQLAAAHVEMGRIEAGEVKNPDEGRKVTHFTDRINYQTLPLFGEVEDFAAAIRSAKTAGATGRKFASAVINGIGGSALGPQLMQFAINGPYWNELDDSARGGNLKIYFTDNTDSAGVADILTSVDLETTLVVSISKSGGTRETKNNLAAFEAAFAAAGLDFAKHAAAITMRGSKLDELAKEAGWLRIFEMAESIGGRTSETSIVGHLPAALAGVDFKSFLRGACHMDEWTRNESVTGNPAYMLASMWYVAGNGRGDRNMVIVPYSDRLILLSRYFQQLVMESLGKEFDLDGNIVNQGLNVFGNKGGTDAHAFIQQLNDGRDDFFATFIEVLRDAMTIPVDGAFCMGDYLHGFQCGLTSALLEKGRQVIQITIDEVNEFNLGQIIALYERAVAFYAELIHINAFHQPGVQAYKLASGNIIDLLKMVLDKIPGIKGFDGAANTIANTLGVPERELEIEGILAKFAENPDRSLPGDTTVARRWENGEWIFTVS